MGSSWTLPILFDSSLSLPPPGPSEALGENSNDMHKDAHAVEGACASRLSVWRHLAALLSGLVTAGVLWILGMLRYPRLPHPRSVRTTSTYRKRTGGVPAYWYPQSSPVRLAAFLVVCFPSLCAPASPAFDGSAVYRSEIGAAMCGLAEYDHLSR